MPLRCREFVDVSARAHAQASGRLLGVVCRPDAASGSGRGVEWRVVLAIGISETVAPWRPRVVGSAGRGMLCGPGIPKPAIDKRKRWSILVSRRPRERAATVTREAPPQRQARQRDQSPIPREG